MIKLKQAEIDKWNEHCLKCYPEEACAIVVKGKVKPMKNVAENPLETFTIDLKQYFKYKDTLEGVIHSHPYKLSDKANGDRRVPSDSDLKGQYNTAVWWGISATEGEGVSDILWYGFDSGLPYEGREFIYNVYDCFELVKDYYTREYNHTMNQYIRQWDWFVTQNLFEENFEREGFKEVSIDDIQKDDVVMMDIKSDTINHIGVYLGDDQILHHLANRLSNVESLARWYKFVKKVVRYTPKDEA